jgi:hypothetical protein
MAQRLPSERLNMYLITDDYGTRRRAWTRADALDWLQYCSPHAEIHNIWGRLVARRIQGV